LELERELKGGCRTPNGDRGNFFSLSLLLFCDLSLATLYLLSSCGIQPRSIKGTWKGGVDPLSCVIEERYTPYGIFTH